MNKFTPGPWSWNEEDWNKFESCVEDQEVEKYLDLQLKGPDRAEIIPTRVDHQEYILDTTVTDPRPKKADRDLIAAAPDLYEALSELCDVIARYMTIEHGKAGYDESTPMRKPPFIEKAEKALAKANGEVQS